ncbi:uncharacterized protein LOC119111205 [Pollicipes pollicipes]|uniref:uncharacterized protein LOC119111205 n=1 Tax=Pollicipes pollicipes TaxID=41117 RepID=UPI0018857463|nr:uncharacterized protein LOC119111205 [Pollicipes pollicipes]
MVVCYSFVFVAVVHCLVDIRLHFIDSQAYKHEALGFLAPVSVALVENRQVFDDPSSSSTPLGRDQGDERDKRWGHVAVVFEKTSLIVYPAAFVLFNICYWAYYLNAARPPHLLAAEMAAGFTPRPSVGRLTTHGNH